MHMAALCGSQLHMYGGYGLLAGNFGLDLGLWTVTVSSWNIKKMHDLVLFQDPLKVVKGMHALIINDGLLLTIDLR